jgi:hypothetical protein
MRFLEAARKPCSRRQTIDPLLFYRAIGLRQKRNRARCAPCLRKLSMSAEDQRPSGVVRPMKRFFVWS